MGTGGFAKVATRIRAFVRPANADDQLPLTFDNPSMLQGGVGEALEGANLSKPLANFLAALDAKMDTIVSLLSQQRLEDEYQAEVEVQEISGEGLEFMAKDSYAQGDVLEFALVLNQYPLRVAAAVGRIEAITERAERLSHTVMFTRIREIDFEAIVQFVFNEERQRIRETKWSR